MDMYTYDLSLSDFSDPFFDPISTSHLHHLLHRSSSSSSSSSSKSSTVIDRHDKPKSPPRHRHDGTSPLPLGMDWCLPPRKWVCLFNTYNFSYSWLWVLLIFGVWIIYIILIVHGNDLSFTHLLELYLIANVLFSEY
jgi:hypothetical protein